MTLHLNNLICLVKRNIKQLSNEHKQVMFMSKNVG